MTRRGSQARVTRAARRLCLGALAAACLAGLPLLALADAPTSADSSTLEQLMALLAQRRHGVADFTENKYLAVLTRPLVSTGELLYDAPDHLEERILTPRAQSMLLDHGMLELQLGNHHRRVRLADYPQLAPLIDCIRATLAGDRAALERVFQLNFSGELSDWQLQLVPRDAALLAQVKRIQMTGRRDEIATVEVLQADGDHSLMSIRPRP